jgi:hypothetical protein
MQASIDLAEAGLAVYLVERSPAIGGTMAQLDKTFPTNDCAMCIMSPKLVEVGRHLNIHILTNAELEGIEGQAGAFRVTLRQHPRFVNRRVPAVAVRHSLPGPTPGRVRRTCRSVGRSTSSTARRPNAFAIPGARRLNAPVRSSAPGAMSPDSPAFRVPPHDPGGQPVPFGLRPV